MFIKANDNKKILNGVTRFLRTRKILLVALALTLSICSPVVVKAQCNAVTTPITVTDEQNNVPNSRVLTNGTNTTVDTGTPGQIKIDATNSPFPYTVNTYSAGSAFTPSANTFNVVTSATGVNLPSSSGVSTGSAITLVIGGSQGATTVSANGSDKIIFNASTTNSSVTLKNGDEMTLVNQGSGVWLVNAFLPQGGSSGGVWSPAQGGTGTSSVPTNGQIPIGNGTTYSAATLTSGNGISIANGSGSVTIGDNPGTLGLPTRRVGYWEPILTSSTTFTGVGITVPTVITGGTVVNNSSSSGDLIEYPTTTALNNPAGVRSTLFTDTQYQTSPIYSCRIQTGSSFASQRIWVGLTNVLMDLVSTPSSATSCAAFRYDTGASDTTFQCITANASSFTKTDSHVSVAASSTYDLVIDMSNSSQILFYINGSLVATVTATLPVAGTALGPEMTITNLGTTPAKTLSVGTMRLESY